MNGIRLRVAALALIALTACDGEGRQVLEPILELPRQLSPAELEIIDNSNAFGFELFARVHAAETGPNVFLSPLSASMALGMVLNGAAGETWDQMRTALHFGTLSEDEINASYRGLLDLLLDLDPRVTVRIGNSVWSRDGFPVQPSFLSALNEYFDAEAREMDFDDPGTVDAINAWASEATNGRIEKVLDSIGPEMFMFLLNALYFKGTWQHEFDPDRTQPASFTREDGSQVTVRMMSLPAGEPLLYGSSSGYQAIELAYGGAAYAMTIVLPANGVTLSDLVASLDSQGWGGILEGMDSASVAIRMPRFRLEYEKYLNAPLVDMGMPLAFGADADFTRLTPPGGVCIQFVKQNTFVEVNEEGTEAAAVTSIGVGVTSAPPTFVVDRPFLFAIRERLTGTILFLGTIGDPTAEEGTPAVRPPPGC